jgi:hypothetical protein
MSNYLSNLKKLSFYEWILFLFPFSQVLGSTYVNIFLIFTSFLFIYEIIKNKLFSKINLFWVYFYFFFILYNFIRGFFASDFIAAIESSFSQFRFLFFALFIYFFIKDKESIKTMMVGWLILVLFVCFDAFYQYFFLKDIFGYPIGQGYPSNSIRLSGPFGKRLVAGAFIAYASIPIISYYFSIFIKSTFQKKLFFSLIYLILLLTVALSGERLSFLIFIGASILIFCFFLDFKKIFISILVLILFLTGIYFKNETFRIRINNLNYVISNFYESSYGRLYESSYLLFKKNYIFGVGFKNYRVDCDRQIDPRPKSIFQFCSTHPHNFYLEILTESGLMGLSIFVICFTSLFLFLIDEIKKNKIIFKKYSSIAYGNAIILGIYFWPFKTSGSFFTTWNGSFFWFNLGVLLLMIKDEKNHK